MNSDQIGNLLYLALLGSVLAFWFFVQNRDTINKKLQQAALWALIFIGAIAAAGLWSDIQQQATLSAAFDSETGEISVPRAPDGHYYLTLEINDTPVRFVVDTGATDMVLTKADASQAGLNIQDADYYSRAHTANGEVRVAPVRLDRVRLGDVTDRNVGASVNDGEMETSLLGMSYLQRFRRLEISGGRLVLAR